MSLYGNVLHLVMVEVPSEAIAPLIQYYDPPLRCFTFQNFQLASTIEEVEQILKFPLGDRKSYLFSGLLIFDHTRFSVTSRGK